MEFALIALLMVSKMKEPFAEKLLDLAINPTNVMEPPKPVLISNNQKELSAR
jgi:hypothetical protein